MHTQGIADGLSALVKGKAFSTCRCLYGGAVSYSNAILYLVKQDYTSPYIQILNRQYSHLHHALLPSLLSVWHHWDLVSWECSVWTASKIYRRIHNTPSLVWAPRHHWPSNMAFDMQPLCHLYSIDIYTGKKKQTNVESEYTEDNQCYCFLPQVYKIQV